MSVLLSWRFVVAVVLIAARSTSSPAQTTARVNGAIPDTSNGAIPSARVTVTWRCRARAFPPGGENTNCLAVTCQQRRSLRVPTPERRVSGKRRAAISFARAAFRRRSSAPNSPHLAAGAVQAWWTGSPDPRAFPGTDRRLCPDCASYGRSGSDQRRQADFPVVMLTELLRSPDQTNVRVVDDPLGAAIPGAMGCSRQLSSGPARRRGRSSSELHVVPACPFRGLPALQDPREGSP
jgi:hypothetical protein